MQRILQSLTRAMMFAERVMQSRRYSCMIQPVSINFVRRAGVHNWHSAARSRSVTGSLRKRKMQRKGMLMSKRSHDWRLLTRD